MLKIYTDYQIILKEIRTKLDVFLLQSCISFQKLEKDKSL